jgi:hypothetical protein
MKTYERPSLTPAGTFKKDTGGKKLGRGDWLFSSKIKDISTGGTAK